MVIKFHSMAIAKFKVLISISWAIILATGCSKSPEFGVSRELATERKNNLSNIEYAIYLSVPSSKSDSVPGRVEMSFELKERQRVIVDYRLSDSSLLSITINSRVFSTKPENGHIIIPARFLCQGANKVDIDFYAGKASLNRKDDFMYSLLVPDRASTVFPCFDQPDLKACFDLTIEVPKTWIAVTNSATANSMETDTSKIFMFDKTKPISTYLFAFAAGKFDTLSRTENGRKIILYHRESDSKKVKRNLDAIFSSHFHALNWLENYAGIVYPFEKLDIVLIPDFQYSGMEHPGAIFYRDSKLFLDENPSENQKLNQANLIAHEVSHQWFGNLVTMCWFNDVWMKEVFAGLMADKIVNPQFPQINHQLAFLLSHYPKAYSVDRTKGSNPIRQNLDNLLLAGTLYGDIIYHKAPIAMMQLEQTIGPDLFQQGIRNYLNTYKMGNASWDQLIGILDSLTPLNLKSWSKSWIEQAEMPTITATQLNDKNEGHHVELHQKTKNLFIPMVYNISLYNEKKTKIELKVDQNKPLVEVFENPDVEFTTSSLQPNSDGLGYGLFIPDSASLSILSSTNNYIENAVSRASNLISIHELFLNGKIKSEPYFKFLLTSLTREKEPQIRNYILGNIEMLWWQFMNEDERIKQSQLLEFTLYKLFNSKQISIDERKPIFQTYSKVAISNESVESLIDYWSGKSKIDGITLSEQDFTNLAYEIAVRGVHESDSILDIQQQRIANPDRLAKFRFIKRAVSSDEAVRDDFFHTLFNAENRRPEPWVSEALRYFNHPLRSSYSIHYLTASLDLLPEIQQTGDIFFPKIWLDATLWGHQSSQAAKIVLDWLNTHPNVSDNLKNKLKQSADLLFRASNMH